MIGTSARHGLFAPDAPQGASTVGPVRPVLERSDMLKTVLAFIVGAYMVVFLAVMLGTSTRVPSWLIRVAVFVLVLLLGLWLALRGEGRRP